MTSLRTGYLVGAVVVFLLCLAIAAAFDVMGWPAVAAALFVAVFAGGGIGMMIAGRITAPSSRPRRGPVPGR